MTKDKRKQQQEEEDKGKGKGKGKQPEPAPLKGVQAMEIRHILVEKQKLSLEIIEMIQLGKKTFNEAAREFSLDKAGRSGLLGWKRRDELDPVFWEAALLCKEGDYLPEPVHTQWGTRSARAVASPQLLERFVHPSVSCVRCTRDTQAGTSSWSRRESSVDQSVPAQLHQEAAVVAGSGCLAALRWHL
jgi:hypothetical protein